MRPIALGGGGMFFLTSEHAVKKRLVLGRVSRGAKTMQKWLLLSLSLVEYLLLFSAQTIFFGTQINKKSSLQKTNSWL
jgi:hypothetical protein